MYVCVFVLLSEDIEGLDASSRRFRRKSRGGQFTPSAPRTNSLDTDDASNTDDKLEDDNLPVRSSYETPSSNVAQKVCSLSGETDRKCTVLLPAISQIHTKTVDILEEKERHPK